MTMCMQSIKHDDKYVTTYQSQTIFTLVQIRLLLLVLGELRAACMRLSMITVRAAAFH